MLYIRTDMNDTIATGHVMRCLSIADAAREKGESVTFILADNQAVDYISNRGYEVIVLGTQWDKMEEELSVLLKLVQERNINSILIDSYQVTQTYLKELSECTKAIYIDDLNKFIYPVDLVICYANYWKKFGYEERYKTTRLLLGTKYIPLRKVFCGIEERQIADEVKNLLLLSGGSDKYHILDGILSEIKEKKIETINVICGRYYEAYGQLVEKYRKYKHIHIYQAVDNIERYMLEADMAVSAGGTTLYELCACGTPTVSYTFADNQLDNAKQFEEDGIIAYAGDARREDVTRRISELIDEYLFDKELRRKHSQKMRELVDGKGAERIVEEVIKI